MSKKIKFLFSLFVFLLIIQTFFVLPLELFKVEAKTKLETKYPVIPGVLPLEEIRKLSKEQQLGHYINYFVRLFFIVAIGVTIIFIIYGGIIYLFTGGKASLVLKARERINQGLLGLAVIVFSYLVLGLINPQFFVFQRFEIKSPPPITEIKKPAPIKKKATVVEMAIATLVDEILEKTTKEFIYGDEKIEFAKIPLEIKNTNIVKKYRGEKIAMLGLPLLNIMGHLENVSGIVDNIIEEFKKCSCAGKGYSHMGYKGQIILTGQAPKCIEGHQCIYAKPDSAACNKCPEPCTTTAARIGIEDKKKEAFCKDKCARDVCANRCEHCNGGGECPSALNKIKKEYRPQIQKTLAYLKTIQQQIFVNEFLLINSKITIESFKYLIQNIVGYFFLGDYNEMFSRLETQGYTIEKIVPKGAPKKPATVYFSPGQDCPFTLNYFTEINPLTPELEILEDLGGFRMGTENPYSQESTKQNKEIYLNSERYFSAFLFLQRLSYQELEKILGECFGLVFEKVKFELSGDTISGIVEKSFKEGIKVFAQYLNEDIQKFFQNFDKIFEQKLENKIKENLTSNCILKCCQKNNKNTTITTIEECESDFIYIYNECFQECSNKKEDISKASKGLSQILSDFLLTEIKNHPQLMPNIIKEILDEKIKDVILSKESSEFLDKDFINFLKENNEILKNILETPLKDFIPGGMKEIFDKKIIDILPKSMDKFIRIVDDTLKKIIDSFEEKIPKRIENYGKKLIEELDKKAEDLITKLPTVTDPTRLSKEDCCQDLTYFYDETTQICQKLDIETLNSFNEDNIKCGDRETTKRKVCEALGGCWNENQKFCSSGAAIPREQWKEIFDFSRWSKNFTSNMFTALLSLPQQIFMALYQTIKHVGVQYITVWVEDEIILPLRPYLDLFKKTKKDIGELFEGTIGTTLPPIIQKPLEKDIDQFLKYICESFGGRENCEKAKIPEKEIQIKIGPIKSNVKPKIGTDEAAQRFCKISCGIYNVFHTDLYKLLPDDIKKILAQKIEDCLPSKWKETLGKSLAQLLWPNITNIEKLIKGTPKDLICGELITDHHNNFIIKTAQNQKSLNTTCNNELRTTKRTVGLLPYLNKESNVWKSLNEEQKKTYAMSCPFIWYICQNPFENWTETIGRFIVKILETECQIVDNKTKKICEDKDKDGKLIREGCEFCKKFPTGSNEKIFCEACNRLNKTLAYSLFKYGMEISYQQEPYTVKLNTQTLTSSFDQYSEERDQLEKKKKEKAAYQWLYVVFDKIIVIKDSFKGIQEIREMRKEIKKVALARNFSEDDWKELVKEIEKYKNIDEIPTITKQQALTFTDWLISGKSVYDILTDMPLGVLKPFKPGEPTLLRNANETLGKEFLAYTPYSFLKGELCRKIIDDFEKDFPTSTLQAIIRGEYAKLGTRKDIPYTVESLEEPNKGHAVQILLTNEEIPSERKSQYLICIALDEKPSSIFGLDQTLIYYIYPKEYRVLFTLINDKLKPHERPQSLNILLNWLFYKNPINLLKELKDLLESKKDSSKDKLDKLLNFLNTPIDTNIRNRLPEKRFIELIFEKLFLCCNEKEICPKDNEKGSLRGPHCPLYKTVSTEVLQELQEFLLHTPFDLIIKALPQQLLEESWINMKPIMDQFPQDSLINIPYLDTFGYWTGLDEPIEETILTIGNVTNEISIITNEALELMRKTFDEILLNYVNQGIKYLVRGLSFGFSEDLGSAVSEQLLGKCSSLTEEQCKSRGENWIYVKVDDNKNECCSLGDPLVCQSRCRVETIEEGCDSKKGEARVTIQENDKEINYCCYNCDGGKCSICREATIDEKTKKECKRNPGKEKFSETSEDSEKFSLCCYQETCCHRGNCQRGSCKKFLNINKDDYNIDDIINDIKKDKYCFSIMECIDKKFTHFLENMVSIFQHGLLLNELEIKF